MPGLTNFQKETMQGLGGHDMAAILGKHPFKTVHDVYMEKVKGVFRFDVTKPMQRGIYLEPALTQYACDELGLRARECPVQVHPKFKFIRGHPDRFLIDPDNGSEPVSLLEAKSTRFKMDWEDEGTDDMPEYVIIQCELYLELTSLSICWVPADVAYEFRLYKKEKTQALVDIILEEGPRFWKDHIEKQVPPPVDGSVGSENMLKGLFPKDTGLEIASDEKTEEMYRHYHTNRLNEAEATNQRKYWEQKLKEEMGAASVLVGDDWKITWKAHDRDKVDYKKVILEAGISAELVQQHTKTSIVRRFNPPRLK